MPSSAGENERRSAFTVLELLVVFTITSLLAGMVVSGMGRARSTARRTMCLSNVKGIMSAIHAYATDQNDIIPYGPTAPPPSPSNLYPVTGLVTSQLSLSDGRPVGLGLLLSDYLGHQSDVLFCPGADQPQDAEAELAKVGTRQAISGFFYRHGSNTLASVREPRGTWVHHITLSRLGRNRADVPIRALVVDQNFVTGVPLAAFGIIDRTNHKQTWVNAGYADGHAETRANPQGQFTVNVGRFPFGGPDMILDVFEKLDRD